MHYIILLLSFTQFLLYVALEYFPKHLETESMNGKPYLYRNTHKNIVMKNYTIPVASTSYIGLSIATLLS